MSKLTGRLLCIVLMVTLVVTLSVFALADSAQAPAPTEEPVCYEHGDVNGDGKVNNQDAVYIMYSYMFGQESFPIAQQWDYNKDTRTNSQDAIYVMYHYMFDGNPLFALDGTIHSYYDPTWVWDAETNKAQVTFKCGCGTPVVYTEANGVTVTAGAVVPATCVAAGSETYVATIVVDGSEYTNTYAKTLPAGNGHQMSGEPDCENGSECTLCDYSVPALGHNYALENIQGATCTENAVEIYRCSTCQDTEEVEQEGTAGHVMDYWKDVQSGCKYVKWYECANCDHAEAGTAASDIYYNHSYVAELTRDATCSVPGLKTYKCTCGDYYTEDIPVNDSHDWVEGATVDGVTSHTCRDCSAEKTTVSVTQDTELSKDALSNELQLENGASMSLDEDTVAGLDQDKSIVVSVTPLEEDDALMDKLSDAQKEQIGNNTVYDFNMAYANGDKISNFAGSVTISLPYTLEEGEDVDSIDVWFIDDNGVATQVTGTYSNGFVTFTTTHFSYYTVTRLTPAERCGRYGHMMVTAKKEASCTQDGFDMSVCQRCGHVEKDEVLPRLTHDYSESTVAATCTVAGSYVKTCKRDGCNHTVTGVIPVLRHDMQIDETQTVEASCTTAGKVVYVCSRPGCTHTKQEVSSQLSHNYETVEQKAADCTNKGYTKKECTLCGDTKIVDEITPVGHTYEVSDWNWSEDHLSAEVVLLCSNDHAHTKTLTAVVNQKKDSATCSGSGTVVYTATASFNQISYTDTYTQTTAAIGHKPGAEWVSNGKQHYHICTVCSEPVDAVDHIWNDGTVTKEPTCNTAGTAIYLCTVCQYENEKTLPATIEHTYVDGVCSGCGKEETDCIHEKVSKTEVDMTGWDICEGAQLIEYSCECGENTYYDWNLPCDLSADSETREIVDYNGQQVVKLTRSCSDCGMSMSYFQFVKIEEDACRGTYAVCYIFAVTGQEPLVGIYNYDYELLHPGVTMEIVDLTGEEYGLCGEKLIVQTCGCEEKVTRTVELESCNWNYAGDDIYICEDCGAKQVSTYSDTEPDGCNYTESVTVTFYLKDVQVYTFTNVSTYTEHNYEATDWEMLGESCEDGILVYLTCADCGVTRTEYTESHERLIEETVDLSGYDICYDSVILGKCACEAGYQSYSFRGETRCEWSWMGNDPETGGETCICSNCKAIRTIKYVDSEKGANCIVVSKEICTITEADGTPIVTAVNSGYSTEHNYETEATLKGETCEDGVTIKRVCTDCGYKTTSTTYHHETFVLETYDLADYGMCGGEIEIWGCACGKETDVNWNDACSWKEFGGMGDEGFEQYSYFCTECETFYDDIVEWVATDDPCVTARNFTYRFYKDFEEPDYLLTVEYTRNSTSHDMLSSFELYDSELGCAGGYKVIRKCQRCDYEEVWTSDGNEYHECYRIGRDTYTSDKLCGDVVVTHYSCPCGDHAYSEFELWSIGCDWNHMGGSNSGDTYECMTCGTVCTMTQGYQKVEGETCKELWVRDFSFVNGEEELFAFVLTDVSESHRYAFTFNMWGATCEDGYDVYGQCLDCGDTYEGRDWGCCTYPTKWETIVNDAAACGTVELVYESCPCGARNGYNLHSECAWEWVGYDEEGRQVLSCGNCGMQWVEQNDNQRIPGTCQYRNTSSGEFILGEMTYAYRYEYIEVSHKTVYNLFLLGESCTDGVEVTRACAYCDYEGDFWTSFEHNTYTTQYYNLEDYGMCGGHVYLSSCGCGQESDWHWNVNDCNFISTGTTDPDTNDTLWFCENCRNYVSWGRDGELNTDTCCFEGEFYFKLKNADKTLLNLRGATSSEQHTTYIEKAELVNPDGDCEDGVVRYWQCQYCDEGWSSTSYGHGKQTVDYVESGCGGRVELQSCVCGKVQDVSLNIHQCDTNFAYYEKTDENGIVHMFNERTCRNCGLNVINEWYDIPGEGCIVERVEIYTVTMGETVKVFRYTEQSTSHKNLVTSATLAPGSNSCEEGIIVTRTCTVCGESEEWFSSGHSTYLGETVELSEYGACGGTLSLYVCPCGQEQDFHADYACSLTYNDWETTGENGVVYEHALRTCSQCGLKEQTVRHKEAMDDQCVYAFYENVTVTVGENQWSSQSMYYDTDHQWKRTYSLLEGSVTCSDGVQVAEYCVACGLGDEWVDYWHGQNLIESVDLSQYSNVCGGALEFFRCPCGENFNWYLNGDDCCDFDQESTDMWIEGAVHEYNPCIDGGWQSYYAGEWRCAVTDPEVCGLVIRRANYSLKGEGCYVTEYETFQIGYDEETGTYQKELTFEVGKKQFHNYTVTSLDTEPAEDSTYTYGEHYVCKDCGSEYYNKRDYNSSHYACRTEEYIRNTLNDGCNRYKRELYTYQFIDGNQLNDTTRIEYIYADGSEYWIDKVFTFDSETCTSTETWRNSDGEGNTEVYEWHRNTTHHNEGKDATCSQPGYNHWWYTCDRCGKTTAENTYTYLPGHCWCWNSDLQTYVCCTCDLQSAAGADGTIIIEDLTEEYGNNTEYVIGYHNPEEHMFVVNVSVILDNAEDDNQIDLGITDITYYTYDADGFTGLSVDKEQTDAAAADAVAALEGYEGSYAIRISFVPINSEYTLDYAITFDSVTAE